MADDDILNSPALLESHAELARRIQQMSTNFNWLLARMDAAHESLCQGKFGTWQQRADQVVEAAMAVATNRLTVGGCERCGGPITEEDKTHWTGICAKCDDSGARFDEKGTT